MAPQNMHPGPKAPWIEWHASRTGRQLQSRRQPEKHSVTTLSWQNSSRTRHREGLKGSKLLWGESPVEDGSKMFKLFQSENNPKKLECTVYTENNNREECCDPLLLQPKRLSALRPYRTVEHAPRDVWALPEAELIFVWEKGGAIHKMNLESTLYRKWIWSCSLEFAFEPQYREDELKTAFTNRVQFLKLWAPKDRST